MIALLGLAFRSGRSPVASSKSRLATGPGGATRATLAVRRLVAALLVLALGASLQLQASMSHASPANQTAGRFYGQTGYTLAAQFIAFFDRSGGVPTFGYPISDAHVENGFLVQWTERQRLEWHPEQAGTEFEVQLGLLGRELTHGLDGPTFQPGCRLPLVNCQQNAPATAPHYFPETGQYVDDLFYDYWTRNGGLRVFGYPISTPIADCGFWIADCGQGTSGNPKSAIQNPPLVQWFERARFEVHPENPPETRVLLGHLGYEAIKARALPDYKFQLFPAQSGSSPCCPIQQSSASGSSLQIGLAQGGESDDPGFLDNIKDAGSALGPGLLRLDNIFNFYNIVQRAPDGTISYHWQQLDRELDAVRAMNKEPLIDLSYMPDALSSTGAVPHSGRVAPPASYDEWAALVRATVTHINVDRCAGGTEVKGLRTELLGPTQSSVLSPQSSSSCPNRVDYWEVWNEPNIWNFWQAPFPEYLRLYDVTVQAALSADPTIKIGGPAVSYFSPDHLGEFLQHEANCGSGMQLCGLASVAPPATGCGTPDGGCEVTPTPTLPPYSPRIDFISWHSYGRSAEEVAADIRQMRKILESFPQFNPQLFITEFNVLQGGPNDSSANGYTDTVEGAIAFLSSIESMQRERLDRALLFELKDGQGPTSFWGRWGILTYDGQPKPLYYALQAYQNRPPGMMPVSLVSGPTDGTLGMMAFGSPARATILLWYTGPVEARVKVALPDPDATAFAVALFDHNTNNPAVTTKDEGRKTNASEPPSLVLRPSSFVVSAGDLLFDLQPNSLVIMTTPDEK